MTNASSETDEAFVRRFLGTWLVQRDAEGARRYLASDFFVHPSMRQTLTTPERALRYAWECSNAPRSCSSVDQCVRDLSIETRPVDARAVEANPELRSREGREITLVSFTLNGCNLGVVAFIDKNAPDDRRVLMLTYIAG